MVLQLKALSKDIRIPVPKYTIGDRVWYISDKMLREWAQEESSPATVITVKLHMFRQGPDFWSIMYFIVFDTPWPEKALSGQPIRELTVHASSLVPLD